MNAKSALTAASVLAVLAVVAVAALLVPAAAWSAVVICALALMALATGQLLFGAQLLPGSARRGGDATTMAAIGPIGLLVFAYLAWSVLTFVIALQGHEKTGWAMIVAGVAGLLVGRLLLHAALETVDSAASVAAGPGPTARWKEMLRMAASTSADAHRARINKLVDIVDFGPSEPAGQPLAVNGEIESALGGLAQALRGDGPALELTLAKIENLLGQRDSQLRLLRSKA